MFVYWITYSRFVWIEKSGNADTVIDVFNIRLCGFTKFELGIFFLPSLCIILLKTSTFLEEDQKKNPGNQKILMRMQKEQHMKSIL